MASLSNLKPSLNRIGKIFAQEAPLYSKHLGVAGRVDCVGLYDGVPSIIDFKTSKKPKKKEWVTSYFMQEAAYAIMWEERTGMPITNLVTIMDIDNEEPMVYIEHRDNWTAKLKETIELYHLKQRQRPL
jgi:genome maintenance exonuclease 1